MPVRWDAKNNPRDYGIARNAGSGLRDWRTLLWTFDYIFVHKNVQKTSTNIQPPWPHAWSIVRLCCHTLDVTSYYCLTIDFTPMILLYCWFNLIIPSGYCSNFGSVSLNRPFPLKGHVASLLWKWKSYDFALKKWLVGHILNKMIVISNPCHFLKMSKFAAGHLTKMWFLKLRITSFWTEILHLNFKEIVEKMMW